jgi:large subunit ribosomal protein L9
VSDDELLLLDQQEKARQEAELATARAIESGLNSGKPIIFKRKVGQNKQLFGSVTGKQILESLKQLYPTLSPKASLENITGADAEVKDALVNNEIRKSGVYRVDIALHPKVSTMFAVEVIPET